MGGGIATTAGGVKLLRLYALYRHGLREMDKLIHPSSLGRRGQGDQMISEGGAAHRLHLPDAVPDRARRWRCWRCRRPGSRFEHSLGAGDRGADHDRAGDRHASATASSTRDLPAAARAILCAAMIVGRMDALVIVALFNPTCWRQ